MRKFYSIAATGVALATIVIPQAAFATDPAAEQYAYEQCSYGQWAELESNSTGLNRKRYRPDSVVGDFVIHGLAVTEVSVDGQAVFG